MMPSVTHTAMGYEATKCGQTLTIHRVPIFCSCERGDVKFDDTWIAEAIAKAKQSEREGYFPPLHIRHHEAATEATNAVRAAGYFRIIGTEVITFKGARRTAIMADLVITDPYIQEEVMSCRLPYRSVEIFNVEKPAIDGLALLDHEAPFLELPMLMVSSVQDDEKKDQGGLSDPGNTCIPGATGGLVRVAGETFSSAWSMDASTQAGPVVACFRHGEHAHLLFREEREMKSEQQIASEEAAEALKRSQQFAAEGEKPADEGEGSGDGEDSGSGLDIAGVVKAISSGEISIKDMDAILEAIQGQKSEPEAEEEAPAATPAPAMAPGAEAMKAEPSGMSEQMAALHGKNEALEGRLDAMDSEKTRTAEVAEAMQRLEGRPLGADLESNLVTFHADHGPKAFSAYVDAMAKAAGVLPGDPKSFHGGTPKVSDIVMKYQEQGAGAVDQAARFSADWTELKQAGLSRMTEERYVHINMAKLAEQV